jgi:serine/threonine protein kinase
LIMEWIEGRSVGELFAEAWQTRKVSIGLGVQIAIQACRALRAVHDTPGFDGRALGWVHGSVSPQNLMVDIAGTLKLVDLGIVQVNDTRNASADPRRASFVAPEMARGERVDLRADVFSLGAILYLLTTGWHPSDAARGSDRSATNRPHASPILPSDVVQGYPRALENVVLRALAPQRDQRFRSTSELLDELVRAFPGYASENDVAELLHELCGDAVLSDRATLNDALERYSATGPSDTDRLDANRPTRSATKTGPNTLAPSYVTTQSPDRSKVVPPGPGRLGLVAAAMAFVVAFASTIALSYTRNSRRSVAAAATVAESHLPRRGVSPPAQSAPPRATDQPHAEHPEPAAATASEKLAPAPRAAPARSTPSTDEPLKPRRETASDSILRRYGI